jgi:iron complex outermembrane receptor protein
LFINPRIGARYTVAPSFSTYVSAGYTGREPTRFDLLGGTQINEANLDVLLNTNTVRPEYALDFEAGVKFTSSVFSADVTAFSMHFTDEIAPIGQYIEQQFVQLRKNVPTSIRQGLELGFTIDLLGVNKAVFEGVSVGDYVGGYVGDYVDDIVEGDVGTLILNVTGTWMHAVIDEYAPENLGVDTVYTNVRPVLTPDFMMSISLRWTPLRALEIEGTMRLVGEQFLELTNQPNLVLDPYAVLDVRASYVFSKFLAVKLAFYNVTSTLYAANGATGWYGDQIVPTLFMQAPFNMVGTVEVTL